MHHFFCFLKIEVLINEELRIEAVEEALQLLPFSGEAAIAEGEEVPSPSMGKRVVQISKTLEHGGSGLGSPADFSASMAIKSSREAKGL